MSGGVLDGWLVIKDREAGGEGETTAIHLEADLSVDSHSRQLAQHENIPRLVHMTVLNRDNVSCQMVTLVKEWMDMNPDYDLRVSDDVTMRQMMVDHYPKLLDLYDGLIYGVEKADLWRYLVVHQYGGVYADTDVESMKPLSSWAGAEALSKYDPPIRLIVSKEGIALKDGVGCRDGLPMMQCNQWTFAGAPGHPVFEMAAETIQNWINNAFFQEGHLQNASGFEVAPSEPWQLGDVLVLPYTHLSEACTNIWGSSVQDHPDEALVCHRFYGTWKGDAGVRSPKWRYDPACVLPASTLEPLEHARQPQ
eukprot:gene11628-34336_t